jgi:hypothetical protein
VLENDGHQALDYRSLGHKSFGVNQLVCRAAFFRKTPSGLRQSKETVVRVLVLTPKQIANPHLLLVAITRYSRRDDPARSEEAGFDFFLGKRPDPRLVQDLLSRREALEISRPVIHSAELLAAEARVEAERVRHRWEPGSVAGAKAWRCLRWLCTELAHTRNYKGGQPP